MLTIRCKQCVKELTSYTIETKCCGCPNMSTVTGTVITGKDLSLIEIVSKDKFQTGETPGVLSQEDKQFQESRRQRKIRRINFETR